MILSNPKERRVLLLLLALGTAGALFFALFFNKVSPAASLQFQVSRPEAVSMGEAFLTRLGWDVSGFKESVVFDSDQEEAVYLQKTLGADGANAFFETELDPWYWRVRWFRFLEEEEFALAISPNGKPVGFYHKIPENAGEGFLSEADALKRAASFLEKEAGVDLTQWIRVSHEQKELENRRNHLFKWVKKQVPFTDGKLMISCGVTGNQIGSFSKYIHVPKEFIAQVEQGDSNRNLLTLIFKLFYLILGVFVGAEFLISLKRHLSRWKIPAVLSLAMFFLSFASELNSLSVSWSAIDTRESLNHFLLSEFLSAFLSAFWSGLFVLMVAVAAESLQKLTWPKKPRLEHFFTGHYFLSKDFVVAVVAGYALGAIQLGYVSAYYMISQRYFGGWSPLESPYVNVASSFIPWVFPLTVGLSAALNEELFFRMFSISFLTRFLKSKTAAIGIPAVIWGFLHSNYYVEPIYSRGVELALVGVVLGWAYLRFGILAPILCHYTYNSVLGLVPLLRSESLFFKTSGWISLFWILFPALLGLFSYVIMKRKNSFRAFELPPEKEMKENLHLRDLPVFRWGHRIAYEFFGLPESRKKELAEPVKMESKILSPRFFYSFVISLVLLLSVCWLFFPAYYGPPPKLKIDAKKAGILADHFLKSEVSEPDLKKKLTVFSREPHLRTGTYLLRNGGIQNANAYLQNEEVSFLRWGVIYYSLGDLNQTTVLLDQEGRVIGFEKEVDDTDPLGGGLSLSAAREKARAFFQKQRPADWNEYQFVGEKSNVVQSRADHLLLWEKKLGETPGLTRGVKILIQGNEIGGYEESLSVPDSFSRELSEKKGGETWRKALMALLVLTGTILVAWDAIFKFREGKYDWGSAFKIGFIYICFDLIGKFNEAPQIWLNIIEAGPLNPSVLLIEKVINLLISEMVTFGFTVFFTAFSLALIHEKFGTFSLRALFSPKRWGRIQPLQGVLMAMLLFPLMWFFQQYLFNWETAFFPESVRSMYPFFQRNPLNTVFPPLTMICSAFKDAILFPLTLGGILAFMLKIFRKPVWVFLFLVLTTAWADVGGGTDWGELLRRLGTQTFILGILALALTRLIRFNLYFFISFFWVRSLFGVLPLLGAETGLLWRWGLWGLGLMLLPLIGVALFWQKKPQHPIDQEAGEP